MSFTRYASFEVSEILDVKGSPQKSRTANLERISDFTNYRTEDGYLYARIRAISSRVNRNHDGWPAVELAGSPEIFEQHTSSEGFTVEASKDHKTGFSTFLGKPIFVDHNNSDPSRARGVIVDAKFHVEDAKTASSDPYYSSPDVDPDHLPASWVELLLEVDAERFPRLAKAIVDGSKNSNQGIDGFSMGCFVPGTPITLADGTQKPIETIVEGDKVLTHTGKVGPVTFTMKRLHKGIIYDIKTYGQSVPMLLTEEHPVWTKKGWVEAKDLEVGDFVLSPTFEDVGHPEAVLEPSEETFYGAHLDEQGLWRRISSVAVKEYEGDVYNFDVEGDDSYVAADIAVHNCDVDHTICNICSNKASAPDEFCDHIRMKGATFDYHDSKTGRTSKKSYENCYGIKFFEISAVFDPADETALLRELIHKEAAAPLVRGMKCPQCSGQGYQTTEVGTYVPCPACEGTGEQRVGQGSDGASYDGVQLPQNTLPVGNPMNDPRWSKTADNPKPQSENITAPEEVDTLRKERVCPVCGSDVDAEKCDVCGYVEPPDGLGTPDLEKHQELKEEEELMGEPEESPVEGEAASPLDASNEGSPAGVTSRVFEPRIHPRLAGRINDIERPIQPGASPGTDEPQEKIIKDETAPVTSHTAAGLIQAAGQTQTQENSMADDKRVAAEPADASGKPDKRIPVDGVGGFMDANAEAASAPDKRIDPEGKGGFMDADNASASAPDEKQTVDATSENSGFDTGGNPGNNSGPTKTFGDNGTRAVTDKAFPTAAATGNKPIGGTDVQPQRRENLEQAAPPVQTQDGTDQWTGTGGNGVTHQQDPVTKKVDPNITVSGITSHIVNVMKLADAEIDLGIIAKEAKYARIAELEQEDESVIAARLDTYSRVRTAGLKRSTTPSISRMPSFRTAGVVGPTEKTAGEKDLDDPRYDSAVFGL